MTEELARGGEDAKPRSVESEPQNMNTTATGGADSNAPQETTHGHAQGPLYKLVVGAIGIVYGDIGTSPI